MTTPRELTEAEFLRTFVSPMRDITHSAEEVVDLWLFLDPLLGALYPSAEAHGWEWRVWFIRESGDARFQHIGVAVPKDNTYIVVVVDIPDRRIVGYHLLDLGEKYGRTARSESG